MSHTAHIRSHRKPRLRVPSRALRTGVAGGVLSTLAVAGAAGSASAAEPQAETTVELPTVTQGLTAQAAASANATQDAAETYAAQALHDQTIAQAVKEAKQHQAAAEKKAKAAARKKAEAAARRAAAERASRSGARTTLSADVSVPSGSAGAVLSFLEAQVGDAYVMGGTGPNSWDCSGLVQAAFKQAGISLPRTSQGQSTAGTQVPVSSAQPGDILYWGSAGDAYHVGVYIGGGKYLAAENPSEGVKIADLSGYPASGAVRVL